ncbi:MAG: transposase [Sphingomonadaceae bacterium]
MLHAVCNAKGRPLIMLLSEGQMSYYKGAALMIDAFPKTRALLADRGYDADWFRAALTDRGISACIPSKANCKVGIPHDTLIYRPRHRIENMFGKLKDCSRIHTCQRFCPEASSHENLSRIGATCAFEQMRLLPWRHFKMAGTSLRPLSRRYHR